MEIRNIRTFIKAAELGSFSKAGLELGYAQSTVTLQMQQLEEELGVSLFDRQGKKISLSQNGRTFLLHARVFPHRLHHQDPWHHRRQS